ncbi:MAG: hypothetical protein KTU85_11965, partial [Acidimicrobiia bacterium]|nr:hypothetical protein [Acidimicrobiia bacterium]
MAVPGAVTLRFFLAQHRPNRDGARCGRYRVPATHLDTLGIGAASGFGVRLDARAAECMLRVPAALAGCIAATTPVSVLAGLGVAGSTLRSRIRLL